MTTEPDWCISDDEQWVADLLEEQWWPTEEEPEPVPERKRDARAYEYDDGRLRDIIEEDNELLELFAILVAAIAED